MRVAQFKLTVEVLEGMLVLPEGTRVIGVEAGIQDEEMRVWVEHPDFPDVDRGHLAPECMPMWRYDYSQPVKVFESWGLSKG